MENLDALQSFFFTARLHTMSIYNIHGWREQCALTLHHARKQNYIYNTTRVAQVLRWLNLEGRRGSRSRNPPVDRRSYIRLETLLEQFCFIRSEPSSVPKRQDNKKLILSWFWLFAVVFSSLKFLSKKGMTTRNHTEQPPDVVASKLDSLSPSPANILNNNIYM